LGKRKGPTFLVSKVDSFYSKFGLPSEINLAYIDKALNDLRIFVVVQFTVGARNFCLVQSIYNGSGAHPASYSTERGTPFPGGKATAW
jgi:hypothetical protein